MQGGHLREWQQDCIRQVDGRPFEERHVPHHQGEPWTDRSNQVSILQLTARARLRGSRLLTHHWQPAWLIFFFF